MNLPKRKKREPMGVRQSDVVRCAGHLAWVRGHECAIANIPEHDCAGKVEAHHVREGGNGGVGLKPDDSTAVPLCSKAHATGHQIGWQTFCMRYRVSLENIAAMMWLKSPHRLKYERKLQQQTQA